MSQTSIIKPSSRIIGCLLVAAITAVVAPSARATHDDPPADLNDLQRKAHKAYENADYAKALELTEKMLELKPKERRILYNAACLHCLLGHKDKAYAHLDKAVKAGYGDAEHLNKDDDFKTIRAEDRFRAIVKRLREAQAPPKPKADKPKKTAKADEPKKADKVDKPKKTAKADEPKKKAKADKPKKKAKADKPKKKAKESSQPEREMSRAEQLNRINDLTPQLIQAAQAGEFKKALKLALKARKIADIGLTNYNVACMYALLKNKDKAFEYLDRAAEQGFDDIGQDLADQMKRDSDMDFLRDDPRYAQALKKAQALSSAASPQADDESPVDFEWKITRPKNFDKSRKVPLIVALHRYNGNMEATTKRWKQAADKVGAILLTPQGTRRLGPDRLHWGRNLDEIEENIMDAIDAVLDKYRIDDGKIILGGFSQGGWITWSLALRNPDTFRGIIPVGGMFEASSPSAFEDEDLAALRIFIMVGEDENDDLLEGNRKAARQFKKIGTKVKLKVYEDVGHDYPENATQELTKALRFILQE